MSLSCQLLDGSTFDVFITGETSVLGSVFSRYETQKSLGAKSGECGGQGNTCSLKSCIRFTVWRAVWARALTPCRRTHEDDKPRRFLWNCWLKLILKHITLHFTVNCLSLLQEMFKNNSFMIPEKSNTFRVAAHEQTCLGWGEFYTTLLNSYVCFTVWKGACRIHLW